MVQIPITLIAAMDLKAGCSAKIKTPVPTIVEIDESKMPDL